MMFETLPVLSPFSAPVYYTAVTDSTMEAAKELALAGAPHGTVILADYQLAGRGRFARPWQSLPKENLLFTIMLKFDAVPKALTLRTGLAVSNAIDHFIAPLKTAVKWPNEVLYDGKKIAGILTEGSISAAPPHTVFAGIGVNVLQKTFSGLDRAAVSIALINGMHDAASHNTPPYDLTAENPRNSMQEGQTLRFLVLEQILKALWTELVSEPQTEPYIGSWRERISARLFQRGSRIHFAPGGRGSETAVSCIISGIGEDGELIVQTEHGCQSFVSGEIWLSP
jgi:BirA family biotin operon repressor/biotin-[acetyl-CoA-carboxylase] ligase